MSDAQAVRRQLQLTNTELRAVLDRLDALPVDDPATATERKALLKRASQLASEVEELLGRWQPPSEPGPPADPSSN